MKNSIATLTTLFLSFSITNIPAADAVKGKTAQVSRSNIANNKTVSDPKDDDCDGRTDSPDCLAAHEVKSPRDAASGQATGKRMHKPLVVTKELDKSTPLLSKDAGAPPSTEQSPAAAREASAPSISEVVVTKPSDMAVECPPGTVPSGSAGCVPATPESQDMAINEKGLPGGTTKKEKKSSK